MTSPAPVLLAARYRIGSPLGAGGMATVYDGIDERLERPVAIKVLRPDMAARADVRARFESEARSAARLAHPNVVAVFDSGEDDGTPYLVMERLPGETLADRMAAGPLDTDWVLRVAGDVLGALGAAHAAGIVHRDVKPGNILVTADGCAKVGDFGIAKSLEVAAAADLTSANQLIGTPAYVAPERISGVSASPQSDLYALGVVLYEALGGRKPFIGQTPVTTAYAIQHETPPPLTSLRPDLPPDVVAAVERAMRRDPAERFSSAADMAQALGIRAAGLATPVTQDATVLAASAVPVAATQVLPTAVAAGSAAPPVSGAMTPAGAEVASAAARRSLFRDRPRLVWLAVAGVALILLLLALAASGGDEGAGRPAGSGVEAETTTSLAPPPPTEPPTTTAPPPPAAAAEPDDEDEDDGGDRGKGRGKKGDD